MARVDRCFKSQRPFQDNAMDHHYWYELPHNNYLKRNEQLLPSSVQYTKVRTKNSDFNKPFYGRKMNQILRKDLDPEWDVKQDCYNPFPAMTRAEMMQNVPMVFAGKNGSQLNDPKSIQQGTQSMDKRLTKLTPNQYLSTKQPMKQPSGVVM
jgi:hypothetical protein